MAPKSDTPKDQLTAALEMTTAMAVEENTMALLKQGLSLCLAILDCERGFLITESSQGMRQVVEFQGSGSKHDTYSSTALQLVNEKHEPLLISDTIEDQQLGVQESIASHDIRSILCSQLDTHAPTFAETKVYLYLDSRTNRRPFSMEDLDKFRLLSNLMANLIKKTELLSEQEATIEELKNQVQEKQFEDLVFGSQSFEQCLRLVKQGAAAEVPMLLVGETGTGKEALAKIVHNLSPRKGKPFLAVNCGAIPSNLIESELFGHEKGAFTGAISAKKGYFEEASEGTLFLDEVGELPSSVQTHFLRVIQENEVVRVGSTKPIKVDVRIVSATNVNLDKAVESNQFRKDLFYRLTVFPVEVPPIRERGEDALLLAQFFLQSFSKTYGMQKLKFSAECEKSILAYDWPGNVREIQNHVQRAVITAQNTTISSADLGLKQDILKKLTTLREAREALDRELIENALSRSPNNLTNAAKILDIDRKSLRLLIEKYHIK